MAPLSAEGISYIQAMGFLKTWGWERQGDAWIYPPKRLRILGWRRAYERAIKIVEEDHK